ncbi:MAG: hypothetical protein IKW19_06845 [Akkermansia sp.]|nr:hypothetical protein [Akkermansia sp.]
MAKEMKLFRVMMPEERLEWIQRFAEWRDREYAVLCGVGEYWSSEHIAMMERGLDLLMAWPFARDFVEKTLMFRDYARRMARLQFYMELISKELSALSMPLDAVPSAPRRRGRPTKEESAQMERERAEREEREAVAKVIAGERKVAVAAVPSLFPDYPESLESPEKPTANGQEPTAPSTATPMAAAVAMAAGDGTRLHLDQLAWLMSDGLRARVATVASLRSTAAAESNQAKALAERGVAQELIEPHSLAAVDATRAYRAIYDDVDGELAALYAVLAAGGERAMAWSSRCAEHGITTEQLAAILKPYWEKMGCPAAGPEPSEVKEAEENRHERAAKIHRIRTYFMRKDRKLTAKRVETMREYIKELRDMGVGTEEYELILEQSAIALTKQADSPE